MNTEKTDFWVRLSDSVISVENENFIVDDGGCCI